MVCYTLYSISAENLALGKPTEQSSTLTFVGGFAEKAVDGCEEITYINGCCTRSLEEPNTWWAVDLAAMYAVTTVLLLNGIILFFLVKHLDS